MQKTIWEWIAIKVASHSAIVSKMRKSSTQQIAIVSIGLLSAVGFGVTRG
jgi:hypothetical protein